MIRYQIFKEGNNHYRLVEVDETDELNPKRTELFNLPLKDFMLTVISEEYDLSEHPDWIDLMNEHGAGLTRYLAKQDSAKARAAWTNSLKVKGVTDEMALAGQCAFAKQSGHIEETIRRKDGSLWHKNERLPVYCKELVVPGEFYCQSCLDEWF